MHQVAVEPECGYPVTYHFFCPGCGLLDRFPEFPQNFLNIGWKAPDELIYIFELFSWYNHNKFCIGERSHPPAGGAGRASQRRHFPTGVPLSGTIATLSVAEPCTVWCRAEGVGFEPTVPVKDSRSPSVCTRPSYATPPGIRLNFSEGRLANVTLFYQFLKY